MLLNHGVPGMIVSPKKNTSCGCGSQGTPITKRKGFNANSLGRLVGRPVVVIHAGPVSQWNSVIGFVDGINHHSISLSPHHPGDKRTDIDRKARITIELQNIVGVIIQKGGEIVRDDRGQKLSAEAAGLGKA